MGRRRIRSRDNVPGEFREGVQRFVPKVANLLKKYGEPFLQAESKFYDELAIANECASLDYTGRQLIEGIRKKSNIAWTEKNYMLVVELYQSLGENLTEIESKRLAYAEKQSL